MPIWTSHRLHLSGKKVVTTEQHGPILCYKNANHVYIGYKSPENSLKYTVQGGSCFPFAVIDTMTGQLIKESIESGGSWFQRVGVHNHGRENGHRHTGMVLRAHL